MVGTITGSDSGTWGSGGINGSIIGGTTAAAGTFTTAKATALFLGGYTPDGNALGVTGSASFTGALTSAGSVQAGSSQQFRWAGGGIITSPAIGSVQLGAADVTTGAVAQTLTFQGNTASTTNGPLALIRGAGGGSSTSVGGELRLSGGLSSAAAGTGGAITFYTAPSGAGNAGVLAMTITPALDVNLVGALTVGSVNGVQVVSTGNWYTQSRLAVTAPSDGVMRVYNWAKTNSVDFTVGASNLLTFNGPINTLVTVVASLPTAGTAGRRAFVTDALTPVFGSAVTGGGAVKAPVYDTGAAWIVG